MPKINYFDSLEHLAVLCNRAVFIACSSVRTSYSGEIITLCHSADKTICDLEGALFSDFFPSLERADIAACAHSLAHIMEKCSEIIIHRNTKFFLGDRKNKEAEICIRLSQLIEENIFRLRRIKKPEELPDFIEFRKFVFEARTAHAVLQRKLSSGAYPRSASQALHLIGQLRCELARTFDDVIELMLNNI